MMFEEKLNAVYNDILEEASAGNALNLLDDLNFILSKEETKDKLENANMKSLKTIASLAIQLTKAINGI